MADLKALIRQGEGISVEFKECRHTLSRDVYETIGAFFREIHRADELGSGMRKLMKYGKAYGGDDPRMVEGDVFRIVVKVPEFGAIPPQRIPLKSESGVESGMAGRIFSILDKGELSKSELAKQLGKNKPNRYLNDLMRQLVKNEMVEYTIPDKPNSPLQKYRLTDAGKRFLKSIQE